MGLFVILILAIPTLPLQFDFLGGGISNYLTLPHIWAWANFDGEHYLAIAREGYRPLTYFFFPFYPVLTGLIAKFLNSSTSFLYSGLIISNIALWLGMIGLMKLIRLDYDVRIEQTTILLLFFFPTSFYFGSVYTESLFFALVVWTFYFARKKDYLKASVLGVLSTATRVVGLALIPALIAEYIIINNVKKGRFKALVCCSSLLRSTTT